ncbi:MAG TPA: hypothetical protein DCY89_08840 [Gammaproteobacteria bacterium]|nr:hypothetical protein [Gammaproteobacteria bacterium]
MDRLFSRLVWLCDWAGVFALICATGSLALHFWFDGAITGAIFLFGVFRWLTLAILALSAGRVIELSALALTGLDLQAAPAMATPEAGVPASQPASNRAAA